MSTAEFRAVSLGTLLVAAFLTTATSALAAPADNEVELFNNYDFGGDRLTFKLGQSEKQRVFECSSICHSLRLGKNVGILLQNQGNEGKGLAPECAVLTKDRDSLNFRTHFVVVFKKGGARSVWPEGHPDGVAFAKYSSHTIVGGSGIFGPELPTHFYAPQNQYQPANFLKVFNTRYPGWDMHWVYVFGKDTYLKIRAQGGQDYTFTTAGKDFAEYDLENHPAYKFFASMEVGTQSGKFGAATPSGSDPGKERNLWEFQVIRFQQYKGGKWVEFQRGQPRFQFAEQGRQEKHVELWDDSRKTRVMLYDDRVMMSSPGTGGQYVAAYIGGGWRDGRDYWEVRPGHYFKNTSGKQWAEFQNNKQAFSFAESKRTNEFVELYDDSRGQWVRLKPEWAESLRKDDSSQKWVALFPGKWELEEAPVLATPGASPATPLANLAGTWRNHLGMAYEFQQTGKNFTWTAPQLNESASGTFVSNSEITAKWSNPLVTDSATGKLTQFDPSGKPTRIEWSNGYVFTRQASTLPAQPGAEPPVTPAPTPILAGKWRSNFGIEYQFKQTGNNFTWTAPLQAATGSFTSNNEVTAQWSGLFGKESATGKITQFDASGKPTRIEWSNGVVFTRVN